MVILSKKSLAIYSLLCGLFLTIAGSAHVIAFSLLPSSSITTTPASSIQTIQQGIPGPGVPGQPQEQQPQQQPQSPPQLQPPPSLPAPSLSTPSPPTSTSSPDITQQQQQGTNEGIIARGIIDSLIFTPSATWIATGNWTIGVNNGAVALVSTNMTWYNDNDNGTASHTHEILNFRPIGGEVQQPIIIQPEDNSLSLRGVVDVAANHRIVWNDVESAIDIKKGGKILSILLNDAQTNNHFGRRPIFGIVTSFTRCSDVPGPNMELLQPCLNIPVPPPSPQSAAIAPPQLPTTTTTPPVSAPPTIAANNTTNFTASSPQPQLPSSNVTGKSPFDILGGG